MPQPKDVNHKELKEHRPAEPEIRNPKSEGTVPLKRQNCSQATRKFCRFSFSFGFRISFGLRPSGFGFPAQPAWLPPGDWKISLSGRLQSRPGYPRPRLVPMKA
jgi:hypothetical protein